MLLLRGYRQFGSAFLRCGDVGGLHHLKRAFASFSTDTNGRHRSVAVQVPAERLDFSFSRSAGPGGQNVNKVNTRAELRFVVEDADWLPTAARIRLSEQQASRMNKLGELIVTAQTHRYDAGRAAWNHSYASLISSCPLPTPADAHQHTAPKPPRVHQQVAGDGRRFTCQAERTQAALWIE